MIIPIYFPVETTLANNQFAKSSNHQKYIYKFKLEQTKYLRYYLVAQLALLLGGGGKFNFEGLGWDNRVLGPKAKHFLKKGAVFEELALCSILYEI